MDDKKRLARAYRDSWRPMGIYAIRNLSNGKILVGSAWNLPGILNRHQFQLKMGGHPNRMLQEDYRTLGADSFAFEVLDRLEPKSTSTKAELGNELELLEAMWVDRLQPFGERGYHSAKK